MAALAAEPFYISPSELDALDLSDMVRWHGALRRWRESVR